MSVERKFKLALDETRLLMLASQILFGFEFQSVFQDGFASWPQASRRADGAGLMLMVLTIAFLLAPTGLHRLAEHGQDTGRLRTALTRFTEAALLPFAMSLGIDLFVVLGGAFGPAAGIAIGAGFFALALLGWYVVEFVFREAVLKKKRNVGNKRGDTPTPLDARIDQMLTEARIALPGAQALLGFQMVIFLSKAFQALPALSRGLHLVAVCLLLISVVLLMAPPAYHRIVEDGEETERLYHFSRRVVLWATVPFGLSLACDLYVVVGTVLPGVGLRLGLSALTVLLCAACWYGYPVLCRRRLDRKKS